MKLKCDQHKRRVMRIVNTHFTHRSDGTTCTSPTATIGTQTYGPDDWVMHLQAVKNHPEPTRENNLLWAIFGRSE